MGRARRWTVRSSKPWLKALRRVGLRYCASSSPIWHCGDLVGASAPPNPQAQLLEQWRQVYQLVRQTVAGPVAIAGKSMGGRMASMLADEVGADGLICLGYPFYAAGKPEKPRVAHLADLKTPTLIIQGERDALGNREAVAGYQLSRAIELLWLAAADHDLKPLKASGFTQQQHLHQAADAIAVFMAQRLPAAP